MANGTIRSQSSSKKSSGGSSQPPKKQTKVSFLYSRYKNSPASAAASVSATSDFCNPPTDEDRDHTYELDPEVCNNNNNNDIFNETLLPAEKKEHFRESMEDKALPADMFPMETVPRLSENVTAGIVPQPADEVMEGEECKRKINAEKRDYVDEEVRAIIQHKSITFRFTLLRSASVNIFHFFLFHLTKKNELFVPLLQKIERGGGQKKRPEKDAELGVSATNTKAKKNTGRSRRKAAELIPGYVSVMKR